MPIGVTLSLPALALSGYLFATFESGVADFQFVERAVWYEPWSVYWHLGVDGISLPMVMLTALLVPLALAASTAIKHRVKEFVVYTLLLEAGLIGVFLSLDLFLLGHRREPGDLAGKPEDRLRHGRRLVAENEAASPSAGWSGLVAETNVMPVGRSSPRRRWPGPASRCR